MYKSNKFFVFKDKKNIKISFINRARREKKVGMNNRSNSGENLFSANSAFFRTNALRVTRGSEILAPHPFSQNRSRIIPATTCFDDTVANIADRVSQKAVDKREA